MDEIIIEESGSVEVVEINSGWQGPIGYTGSAGIQGEKGQEGPQGPIGYTGSRGTDGLNGTNGIDGQEGPQGPIGYTGSRGTGGGASALDDLTDVTITNAATGQILSFDGSVWINKTIINDITATTSTVYSSSYVSGQLGDISAALTAILGV